jgi:CubicO group peptidase (beta-lactamase class C family)
MSASAADMAKFMLAHLSGGSFGSGRILSESGVERMHARAFAHDERLNGSALGSTRSRATACGSSATEGARAGSTATSR